MLPRRMAWVVRHRALSPVAQDQGGSRLCHLSFNIKYAEGAYYLHVTLVPETTFKVYGGRRSLMRLSSGETWSNCAYFVFACVW